MFEDAEHALGFGGAEPVEVVGRGDESRRSTGAPKRGSIFVPGFSPRQSADADEDKNSTPRQGDSEKLGPDALAVPSPMSQSQSLPASSTHRRAATTLDSQGRAARHERRNSAGAALFASAGATIGRHGGSVGRHRRPSTGYSSTYGRPLADKLFGRTDEEDEAELEQDVDVPDSSGSPPPPEAQGDEKEFKSVYMKGLFRYD